MFWAGEGAEAGDRRRDLHTNMHTQTHIRTRTRRSSITATSHLPATAAAAAPFAYRSHSGASVWQKVCKVQTFK